MNVVSWFSAGAASAVATKLALAECPEIHICYQETGSEHPDNERFIADCERWFGREVTRVKSDKYADTWDTWEKRRYIAGISGAPCTSELKRIPAESYLFTELGIGTTEIFGYTAEEEGRVKKWIANNNERVIRPILIEKGITKGDCLALIERAGIELPAMYKLGFANNNCVGCPKGGAGYWNKIRQHFPLVFNRMALLEREIGAASIRLTKGDKRERCYLDELPLDAGRDEKPQDMSCGIFCMAAESDF